jgi:type IV pilus assembly protein PilY1
MSKKRASFKKSVLALAAASLWLAPGASGWAAQLDLVQSPPSAQGKPPAPNVILSLDDSASMWGERINLLKQSLNAVFGGIDPVVKDGEIRLAWQVMCGKMNDCYYGPVANKNVIVPGAINSMKVLDAAHRANFIRFINNDLKAVGNTDSHVMMRQADEYMRLPKGISSPWAAVPGKTEAPYLGCRRAYHIFLTDGGWNDAFDWAADLRIGIYSHASHDTPDGKRYDPDNAQMKIFRSGNSHGGTLGFSHYITGQWFGITTYLADWALKSWMEDLQPDIPNQIRPGEDYLSAPATETFASGGRTLALEKYWNPRYDPATWQHLTTYTIGYGSDAATGGWGGLVSPTNKLPYGFDGDIPALITGAKRWPDAIYDPTVDMWPSAINGRGRFYAVQNPADLINAFKSILETIIITSTGGVSSVGQSGGSSINRDVGIFAASYNPSKAWSGWVSAKNHKTDGAKATPWTSGGTEITTAGRLDALTDANVINNRLILTATHGGTALPSVSDMVAGVSFKCGALTGSWGAGVLGCDASSDLVNYLRGDRSKEGSPRPGTGTTYRKRESRQGDIINSGIWYVGAPSYLYNYAGYSGFMTARKTRTPMIYVGGNDGMLHGFDATTGAEKIAYVPRGVYTKLSGLADSVFVHKAFVDNTPVTGDVNVAGPGATTPDWRTLLVGTLGAGARGYFVLDVTNPANFDASNAAQLVVMDKTLVPEQTLAQMSDAVSKDIGHIFASPVLDDNDASRSTQITQLNNGRWAVVMGNGYNSANERPVLLIQYLDGAKEIKTIVATGVTPPGTTDDTKGNGLSAPRLVDLNGDGAPDIAYAGDLKGNLWKFDLTSAHDNQWTTAFGNTPFYIAKDTADKRLPITTAPVVKANTQNAAKGLMVAFGTGQNLTEADRASVEQQIFYSVMDRTKYRLRNNASDVDNYKKKLEPAPFAAGQPATGLVSTTNAGLSKLQPIGMDTSASGTLTVGTRDYARTDTASINWTAQDGWYFVLPVDGERILKTPKFYDGSNLLDIISQVPAQGNATGVVGVDTTENGESCSSSTVSDGKQYLTMLDIRTGKPPSIMLFDTNGDGFYTALDGMYNRLQLLSGVISSVDTSSEKNELKSYNGTDEQKDIRRRMPIVPVRANWFQLE